ncbi:MAG: hypothetical protein QHJ82_13105 [Verrucomicrobiota bacterium]|nr:hypothetical protein [Verrucomicrobiota bacterium]
MSRCLEFEDILRINRPEIDRLQEIGDSFESLDQAGACEMFSQQVQLLEGAVIQCYKIAAVVARKGGEFSDVAEVWERMSQFCQLALEVLRSLKDKYPHCGTAQLYDLVLDYKLAADKRLKAVQEEIECEKRSAIPNGLFPDPR